MEVEKRGTTETEHEDCIHTVLFVAGTALLMACLKRAVVASFMEQWRVWVFLLLNLILLAIVFTSIRPISTEQEESNSCVETHIESKKRRKQCDRIVAVEKRRDCCKLYKSRSSRDEPKQVEDSAEDSAELPRLSKEELNERVEAFIAMFRQHLVSDAAKKW